MRKPKDNTRHAQSQQASVIDHKAAPHSIRKLAARVPMRIASSKFLAAFLLVTLSISVFAVRFRPAARAATASGPEHVLSFAYYSIKDDWDSTLTLNNSSVIGLVTTVTVYSLDGRALTLPTLEVKANSNIAVSLRDFISRTSQTGQFQEGIIDVRFNSDDSMAIAPQLTVWDAAHGLSFDVEPPMMPMSSTWEGLWWSLDAKTSGQVMLSNTTDKPLKSVVNVEWRGTSVQGREVSLSGHQTAVLDIKEILSDLQIEAQGIERGGLSITHNGMPGAVIVQGVILKKESRFSSNLLFVDPAMQKNSVLNGTGLMLAHPASGSAFPETSFFTPQLALRNVSGSSQKASVTVRYAVDGVSKTKSLPEITIAPHDVQMGDFSSLMSDVRNAHVTAAGLTIESSGAPGTLVAALSSVDDSQNLEVDVPLVSRSPRSGEGGNHPFRLDEEFRSVAYLTNITQKPTKVAVIIFHDGGMYTPELISVAAGATLAIDLLQLRDSQAKDIQGRTLPVNLARGQFFWHPHQGEALIGRVVTFDKGIGTAGNFSCPNCCQQEPNGLVFIPAPVSGQVGEFCQLTVNEYETYCGQYTVGPYNYTNSVAYSCNNSSVATVNSTGMVSCLGWVTATVTASLDYYHSDYISAEDCGLFLETLTSDLPIVVVQVAFQKSDGTALPDPLRMGISATTLGGTLHDRTQHLRAVITPAAEASNVTISGNNKLTVTQGTTSNGVINFDCVGKNQSGSHGDGTIKANHSGMVIGTAAVDVLVPHNVSATHDTVGGGLIIANRALDATTSPGWVCLPPGQVRLMTIYVRFLTVTVCDQFGGLMGDLYQGAEVSELADCDGVYHSINQPLSASSTYLDPDGTGVGTTNVAAGSADAINWPTQPRNPIPAGCFTEPVESIQVKVDGFLLSPGIANRQWTICGDGVSTTSPPVTVTISW